MPSRPNIVHILYSGVGGQAGVFFPLAKAGASDAGQCAAFYGVEPVAPSHIERCEEMRIPCRAWQKKTRLGRVEQESIADWIVQQKATAVVLHNPAAIYACIRARKRLPGLRIVAVEHHCNALKSRKRWLFSAIILRAADRAVYLTEAYRDEVRKKLGRWFIEAKSAVIPNGLDLTAYPLADPRYHSSQPFLIGMQGRMVDGKDFATLLRALAVANSKPGVRFHLELAGDGPDRPGLEKLALELGVAGEVSFLGFLTPGTLATRMSQWNAYVHSSLGETMSIAIMEAKACALPIVATDAPGVGCFFVDGVNGILVPPGDAARMAGALLTLSANEDLRFRFARAGREEAELKYSSLRAWAGYSVYLRQPEPKPRARLTATVAYPV